MAKVEIIGTDAAQFWPRGDSDADTVVVAVREFAVDGERLGRRAWRLVIWRST